EPASLPLSVLLGPCRSPARCRAARSLDTPAGGSYTRGILHGPGRECARDPHPIAFDRALEAKEAAVEWRELIVDGFERLPELAHEAMAGVRTSDLDWQPRPGCNPLGWTVWHLTRVQDGQVADLMGHADLWTRDGWHQKFDRPADHDDSGYGHT